jgi:hypothetical protein
VLQLPPPSQRALHRLNARVDAHLRRDTRVQRQARSQVLHARYA